MSRSPSNEPHIRPLFPVAQSIAALLGPLAEVVVHDLASGRIAAIWNADSGRRVGDESLLDIEPDDVTDTWGPYLKRTRDGRPIKSTSALFRAPDGTPLALLCVNLDTGPMTQFATMLQDFLAVGDEQPAELFRSDREEQLRLLVHQWLGERGIALKDLKRAERIDLVGFLFDRGVFQTRNAATTAAHLIGVSRASIYADLRRARGDGAGREQQA